MPFIVCTPFFEHFDANRVASQKAAEDDVEVAADAAEVEVVTSHGGYALNVQEAKKTKDVALKMVWPFDNNWNYFKAKLHRGAVKVEWYTLLTPEEKTFLIESIGLEAWKKDG